MARYRTPWNRGLFNRRRKDLRYSMRALRTELEELAEDRRSHGVRVPRVPSLAAFYRQFDSPGCRGPMPRARGLVPLLAELLNLKQEDLWKL